MRTGGSVLVEQLRRNGTEFIYGVPGESYLAALDALHDAPEIKYVTCRHEAAAANMADAYGKLTGRPGVCFVTRGPGATHASIGIHTAFQDSTPLVMLVGQVARVHTDREAFQELDYRAVFGSMTKWTAEVRDPERLPEYLQRAFATATSGRPGPVVLALPEDVLSGPCDAPLAPPYVAVSPRATPTDARTVMALLARAERPLVLLGGSTWSETACRGATTFAESNRLPVATTFRRADVFDNRSDQYVGHLGSARPPALARMLASADLVLAIGTRLGDITTESYASFAEGPENRSLIHVHPSAEELGAVFPPTLAVNASAESMIDRLLDAPAIAAPPWSAWTEAAHQEYLDSLTPTRVPGRVNLGDVVEHLREQLPPDTIVTNGAGNYSGWVQRFYQFRRFHTYLGPTNGAMGYGVPAAIAAKLLHPERTVIAFAGDGCFSMAAMELATAVQHHAPIIVLIVNNGIYGTIRMHQERNYPARVTGTDLINPDFAGLAQAFGAYGETVRSTEAFANAFARARDSGRPAVLDLQVDAEALTPSATMSELRGTTAAAQ